MHLSPIDIPSSLESMLTSCTARDCFDFFFFGGGGRAEDLALVSPVRPCKVFAAPWIEVAPRAPAQAYASALHWKLFKGLPITAC